MPKTRYKVKATIYDKKGRVISTGVNSYSKTHPLQSFYAVKSGHEKKIFLHAEIKAIINAKRGIDKAYLMRIERYDKNGKPANAKPCAVCEKAIKYIGIKKIEYTC